MSWLLHVLGIDDLSGPWYGFWSGFGSDITEFGLLGVAVAWYRRNNCEIHKCKRIGRHEFFDHEKNVTHHLCRSHHPDNYLTHARVLRLHRKVATSDIA